MLKLKNLVRNASKKYAVTGCYSIFLFETHRKTKKKKHRKKKQSEKAEAAHFHPKQKQAKQPYACSCGEGGGAGVPTSSLTFLIFKVTYKLTPTTSSTAGLHNIVHYMIKAPWLSSFVGQGSKSPWKPKPHLFLLLLT